MELDIEHDGLRTESLSEDPPPCPNTRKRTISMAADAPYRLRDNENEDVSKDHMGWMESITYMAKSLRWINVLILVLPFAWAAYFEVKKSVDKSQRGTQRETWDNGTWGYGTWGHGTTFILCFIAMIPLQKLLDWTSEEMAVSFSLSKDLRDLLTITLSNAVEATLAIMLLLRCQLRLLQSTIVGVVLLHLLLIQGVAMFVQGTQVFEQKLPSNHTNLNMSLLMIGVLATLVPTTFFAVLARGNTMSEDRAQGISLPTDQLSNHALHGATLRMSRGISVILLVIYVTSCLYPHFFTLKSLITNWRVPRKDRTSSNSGEGIVSIDGPVITHTRAKPLARRRVHPGFSAILLVIALGLMGPTAEFLVSTLHGLDEHTEIKTEWFGLVLLPTVSFSADGFVVICEFSKEVYNRCKTNPETPSAQGRAEVLGSRFTRGRSIDQSIQFILWWTPILVLLGWWANKPITLDYDYFEVFLLLGSCLLVNYVTSDSKTNMSEGLTILSFYVIIATAAWFYPNEGWALYSAGMYDCPPRRKHGPTGPGIVKPGPAAKGLKGTRGFVAA